MCGIFGVLWARQRGAPSERQLLESARSIQHRGPDNVSVFAADGIGLGHTRLALVDLNTRSNQPFWDATRRHCIVYNGEIYNFRELGEQLEREGMRLRTTCDTEVLIEALLHWGVEETLPRLEGMFAFALYDSVGGDMVLARDRYGIKPLYIFEDNDLFMFASEIQAMRPWIEFKPDILSISAFLQGHNGPMKGHCFYRGVKIVAPGWVVQVKQGGRCKSSRFFGFEDYWDPEESDRIKRTKPDQVADQIEELLLESVKSQLQADARVGALCSGGVDSSLIMAMATKYHNDLAIFHANVRGPSSEYEAAKSLAEHLHLDLKSVDVNDQDFIDLLPEVTAHYGHPFMYLPHSIPFYMVSHLVREHGVKGVLSGEGADECFMGYDDLMPNFRRLLVKSPLEFIWNVRELRKQFKRWSRRNLVRNEITAGGWVIGMHNRFEIDEELTEIFDRVRALAGQDVAMREVHSIRLLSYHLRTLLHRNDCLGMSASIEARFPFLNNRLVKLAINIPYNYKVRWKLANFNVFHPFLTEKWILRLVANRYLPPQLAKRPKLGFLTGAFQRAKIDEHFFDTSSFVAELFDVSARQLQFLFSHADHRNRLRLLHLEVWAQVCLMGESNRKMADRLRQYVSISPN